MEETVNQEEVTADKQEEQMPEDRLFTQEEVNRIVVDRIERERAKYPDYDDLKVKAEKFDAAREASKTELEKATEKVATLQAQLDKLKRNSEVQAIREKVSKETGIPINLISADSEESCAEQAKAILEFAKPGAYPIIRDGGDPQKLSKKETRDQFAEWAGESIK